MGSRVTLWQVLFKTNMDREKYLRELMEWIDPYSILVLDENDELQQLHCPFKVIVVVSVGEYTIGDVLVVEVVKLTIDLRDVYVINGKAFYVTHFRLYV